jgi:Rrf2 family nitric oxide-sensitive transcriptional repressor
MRLLASTDLALRVLMLLAAGPPERQLSVEALSRELGGLSRHHLHKIVQDLAARGVVRTTRGAGGGVRLAVPPKSVRLGGLMRYLEDEQPLVECFRSDGGCCSLTAGCGLRGILNEARETFYACLDAHSLADCVPDATPRHLPAHV